MTEALKDTPKNTIEEKNKLYEKAFEIACSNRVLLLNDPAIDAISKELKKALGNELVSRIEHLDRNKAIMIVCGDDHLTKGIVDYIWYTHPTKLVSRNAGLCPAYIRLRHRSYSRWTEEQIMSDLFGWHISLKEVYLGTHDYKFKWDYIQFLQDIKTEHLKVFQRLLEISRNYKLGNERMLIVSTDKVDNLPQDLKDQFEIIGLEPGAQDAAKQDNFIPFPPPSGTQWHEVKICFIDKENVSIKIKNNVVKKHYAEMGFKDNRTGNPSKLWVYFKGLSSSNGEITDYQNTKKAVIEKNISDLRRMLKRCFAIKDDPIPYKKTKAYTGYKTVFLIEDKSYTREHEASIRQNYKKDIPPKENRYKDETEDLDNETNIDD